MKHVLMYEYAPAILGGILLTLFVAGCELEARGVKYANHSNYEFDEAPNKFTGWVDANDFSFNSHGELCIDRLAKMNYKIIDDALNVLVIKVNRNECEIIFPDDYVVNWYSTPRDLKHLRYAGVRKVYRAELDLEKLNEAKNEVGPEELIAVSNVYNRLE